MGTTSSTTNINTMVNSIVTNTISTSLQNTGNEVLSTQSISIDCSSPASITAKGDAITKCMGYWSKKYSTLEPAEMVDLVKSVCNQPWNCGGDHITLSGNLNANLSTEQVNNSITNAQSAIENNINQKAQTTTGLLKFGENTKNVIHTQSGIIVNTLSTNFQNLQTSIGSVEELSLKGTGTLSYISMDTVTNAIGKFVQENSTVADATAAISNSIAQDASSTSVLGGEIGKIIMAIIAIFVIGGIALVIFKAIGIALKKKQLAENNLNTSFI